MDEVLSRCIGERVRGEEERIGESRDTNGKRAAGLFTAVVRTEVV